MDTARVEVTGRGDHARLVFDDRVGARKSHRLIYRLGALAGAPVRFLPQYFRAGNDQTSQSRELTVGLACYMIVYFVSERIVGDHSTVIGAVAFVVACLIYRIFAVNDSPWTVLAYAGREGGDFLVSRLAREEAPSIPLREAGLSTARASGLAGVIEVILSSGDEVGAQRVRSLLQAWSEVMASGGTPSGKREQSARIIAAIEQCHDEITRGRAVDGKSGSRAGDGGRIMADSVDEMNAAYVDAILHERDA